VHISVEELERFALEHAVRRETNTEMFRHHQTLYLDYEDILHDRDTVFARAQEFLGLEPVALVPSLQRQNPEPLSDLVSNYDLLKRELSDGPLAACFEE
jgi:hypothetical protein